MNRPAVRQNFRVVSMGKVVLAVMAAAALAVPAARAMWALRLENVPVDRLVKNTDRYIQEHPKDAQGYYVMGRLHSMAFASGADQLRIARPRPRPGAPEDPDALPGFWPPESILVARHKRPTTPALRDHLTKSIRNYRKATELDPKMGLAWLGLGWVLEEASNLEEPLLPSDEPSPARLDGTVRERIRGLIVRLAGGPPADRDAAAEALARELPAALPLLAEAAGRVEPEVHTRIVSLFARYWQDRALAAYRRAYALSFEQDRKRGSRGPGANSLISLDAAVSIQRIFGRRPLTGDDRAELDRMAEHIKTLPYFSSITPLIFSLEAARPLADLLDPSRRVRFDLAGDGRPVEWPWVRPETALLVWDRNGTGRITSGRQLFGSVTWWIFWRDGYEPLALLDDNGDGWVAGRELDGLAVWRDRDGNGRSDPGEVTPAAQAGIARLAAQPDGQHGTVPWNARGLVTTDGRVLPTYDWTPTSVGAPLKQGGSGGKMGPRVHRRDEVEPGGEDLTTKDTKDTRL